MNILTTRSQNSYLIEIWDIMGENNGCEDSLVEKYDLTNLLDLSLATIGFKKS